jgi:hypothetical protein
MESVKREDLTPGRVYMITATTGQYLGLVGRLMKLAALDGDFCVMAFTDGVARMLTPSIYRLDEFTFSLPSPAFMQAALPEECWEETLDVIE